MSDSLKRKVKPRGIFLPRAMHFLILPLCGSIMTISQKKNYLILSRPPH
jgi:hypothetical protein